MRIFFEQIKVDGTLVLNHHSWVTLVDHLVGIIEEAPLLFPNKLNGNQQKIYNHITTNSIKSGAGVIAIWLELFDYGNAIGKRMCLHIRLENTTTIVVPLVLDVSLPF